MAYRTFFHAAKKNIQLTGAVAPSSRFLIQKMIAPVDFAVTKLIVELGPGEGCITKELLKKMRADAQLIVFEKNPLFCAVLRTINDPRMVVVEDSAENMDQYLKQRNIEQVPYIISSLPFGSLPKETAEKIHQAIHTVLAEDGRYIQFQYFLHSYLYLKKTYKKIETAFTVWNIPPAFVYVCQKG